MFMTRCSLRIRLALLSLMMGIFVPDKVFAHEPVFSLGPETIFKGGVGLETEFEFEEAGKNREKALRYEIIYGLTKDMALTLSVPQWLDRKEGAETSRGLGDIVLRGKYQFYRKDSLGAQDKAALIYGLEVPTGDDDQHPVLGNGALDHVFGLSLGHESRRLYGFVTGRYVLRTDSGSLDKGDRVLLDVAFGVRPWLRPYKSWDLVFLLENSYIWTDKDERDGVHLENSGGQKLLVGPTFLWSIRNVMVKGGVQFPVWEDVNGNQQETDFRSVAALEYHF